ncbi:Quinone oxidoreductase [Tolypocladium ophioglossoides CBS 100239]|uniref:Quinone oxidoreductase n=1 Tax=Tolypocladium ophioglossoides (strain CBS 100239) TaxID=1163406 RepID=A0A0L0NAG3_TOLOC|nr:Quinone oxidoreductase [Tolypocladium ophioglossoides CBS 100239]
MDEKMEELSNYGDPKFTALRRKVDIPKPGPNEVLIKVIATGLNPKDWKSEALNAGDDVAGFIENVGDGVFEYNTGDRVAAFHRITEPGAGYAEYAIAPASTTFRLPPNISFEAGAGLPLVTMTAAISLYQALQLPLPTAAATAGESIPVLIYGSATAVGAYALQLAKLSKLSPIIAVAGNGIEYVKSLNTATHIIDYRDGNVADKVIEAVRAAAPGQKLHHVLDAVSDFGSHKVISEILVAFGGGQINMLDPGAEMDKSWQWPEGVKFSLTFVASAYGRKNPWMSEERAAADKEFAYWFYRYITHLLAEGELNPHPHKVLPNGLDGILQGVQDLKNNKVSGKKLVARHVDSMRCTQKSID